MNIYMYIHDFKLWWLHDNHFWIAIRIYDEEAQLLQFSAYGVEKQRFNQIKSRHWIIFVEHMCYGAI